MAGSSSAFSVESLVSLDPASLDLIKASTEPRWRQFLHFWLALASEKGDIPARGDLDPARLGTELLPNVFLVDVVFSESDKPRFRFRLLGEAIQERETTRVGDFLDGLVDAADRATIERHYQAALEGKVSIRRESLAWNARSKGTFMYEVMMLPLTDQKGSVAHLIGLALYAF